MPGGSRKEDISHCQSDSHGCPDCPHDVRGPAVQGSRTVEINGSRALRKGDRGIHESCCSTNTWTVKGGAPMVFINGKPAARHGDMTHHCGGAGEIVTGSSNVIIGNNQSRLFRNAAITGAPCVEDVNAQVVHARRSRELELEYLREKGVFEKVRNYLNDKIGFGKLNRRSPRIYAEKQTEYLKIIRRAKVRALEMIRVSIEVLEAAKNEVDDEVKTYFSIDSTSDNDRKLLSKLIGNYKKMASGLRTAEYRPQADVLPDPDGGVTVAYVVRDSCFYRFYYGPIRVNFPPFNRHSPEKQAKILVHEISHYSANTEDYAYREQTQEWEALTKEEQIHNADSYANFSMAVM